MAPVDDTTLNQNPMRWTRSGWLYALVVMTFIMVLCLWFPVGLGFANKLLGIEPFVQMRQPIAQSDMVHGSNTSGARVRMWGMRSDGYGDLRESPLNVADTAGSVRTPSEGFLSTMGPGPNLYGISAAGASGTQSMAARVAADEINRISAATASEKNLIRTVDDLANAKETFATVRSGPLPGTYKPLSDDSLTRNLAGY